MQSPGPTIGQRRLCANRPEVLYFLWPGGCRVAAVRHTWRDGFLRAVRGLHFNFHFGPRGGGPSKKEVPIPIDEGHGVPSGGTLSIRQPGGTASAPSAECFSISTSARAEAGPPKKRSRFLSTKG